MTKENSLVIFQNSKIRRKWYKKEWWFSVVDVVGILINSLNYQKNRNYWKVLKSRLKDEGSQVVTECNQLKLKAYDEKFRVTDTANTKILLRIVQSIPSPKAEPFKLWLAQVGKERLDEIENPELAQERMKSLYEKKGYPKDWIDKRLRGIAIRQNLTDEWKERGIKNKIDYAILTAEISEATFGMTPSEYKKFKGIPTKSNINLRDNMTDLELIFTMLGERVTTEISKNEKPKVFNESKKIAYRGGKVAGKARLETEKEIGKSVITGKNYLK